MGMDHILSFCGAFLIWVLLPGPAIFAIIANSLTHGFRSSVHLILGILLGDVFYMSLVLVGMTAIGRILGNIFIVIRFAGAFYLIYLGIRLWYKPTDSAGALPSDMDASRLKSFFSGFSITLGNPKAILFHLGFLPTFFNLATITPMDGVMIISVFLVVLGTCLSTYALAATKARALFKDPRKIRLMNRGAGTVLVGTGVVLLARK